jgi:hypothetical protein
MCVRVPLILAVGLLMAPEEIGNGQDDLIAEISTLGGYYSIDPDVPGKPTIKLWLRATAINDAWLARLKQSRTLLFLDLTSTKISDAGLKHLMGLKSLRHLDLSFTKVTPGGVKKLQQALPKCRIRQ